MGTVLVLPFLPVFAPKNTRIIQDVGHIVYLYVGKEIGKGPFWLLLFFYVALAAYFFNFKAPIKGLNFIEKKK
jgi:hypothetical protein